VAWEYNRSVGFPYMGVESEQFWMCTCMFETAMCMCMCLPRAAGKGSQGSKPGSQGRASQRAREPAKGTRQPISQEPACSSLLSESTLRFSNRKRI
jgi:hypothetical protein